jgi:hypothetical protein
MVKLVAYTIVSVRRGAERVMTGPNAAGTVVITERMTREGLVLFLVSRYLGSLSPEERRAVRPDVRFLRVDYTVSQRWPREPLEFERDQVAELEGIAAALWEEP